MTFTVSENGKSMPTSISASVLGVRKRNETLLVAFDLPESEQEPYVISIDFFICICSQHEFVLLVNQLHTETQLTVVFLRVIGQSFMIIIPGLIPLFSLPHMLIYYKLPSNLLWIVKL